MIRILAKYVKITSRLKAKVFWKLRIAYNFAQVVRKSEKIVIMQWRKDFIISWYDFIWAILYRPFHNLGEGRKFLRQTTAWQYYEYRKMHYWFLNLTFAKCSPIRKCIYLVFCFYCNVIVLDLRVLRFHRSSLLHIPRCF